MENKPIFVDRVTHVPAEWANILSALAYDIFDAAITKGQARVAIGVGTLGIQDAALVQIAGGTIDGTTIGLAEPATAKFTRAWAAADPIDDTEVANKHYVDQQVFIVAGGGLASLASAINLISARVDTNTSGITANSASLSLLAARLTVLENVPAPNLGTLASQNANSVAITGGTINGASIGSVTPSTAVFTRAWVATTPIDPSEASSKSYVDGIISTLTTAIGLKATYTYVDQSIAAAVGSTVGLYLPLTGGALTGALTLPGDPVNNLHAASKQYVDNKASNITSSPLQRLSVVSGYYAAGAVVKTGQHMFEWAGFEKPLVVHTGNFVVYADGIMQKTSAYSVEVGVTPIFTFADEVEPGVELDIIYYNNLKDPRDVAPVDNTTTVVVDITGIYEDTGGI